MRPHLAFKTDTPLVVDPYAVLSLSVPSQGLQTIPWRRPQIVKFGGNLNHAQLTSRNSLDIAKTPAAMAQAEPFSLIAAKRLDHSFLS